MKIFILSLVVSGFALAADPQVIRGDLPQYTFPGLEEIIARVWKFVQTNSGLKIEPPPPLFYIADFDFKTEDPTWVAFQKAWIPQHPDVWDGWRASTHTATYVYDDPTDPFLKATLGYHYDDTNRIQLNPKTFLRTWAVDPYGVYKDLGGAGYYSVGHEATHYALDQRKIPGRLHHCLFIKMRGEHQDQPGLMEALVDFLEDNHITANSRQQDFKYENYLNPCGHLTADELKQVERYRELL